MTGTVLQQLEPACDPALPVEHEAQPTGLERHDDLLEDGAQNPLAGFGGSGGMVPDRRQVVRKGQQRRTLVVAKSARLLVAQSLQLFLEPRHRRQTLIPSAFKLACDEAGRLSGSTASYCRRACVTS